MENSFTMQKQEVQFFILAGRITKLSNFFIPNQFENTFMHGESSNSLINRDVFSDVMHEMSIIIICVEQTATKKERGKSHQKVIFPIMHANFPTNQFK